MKKAFLVLLMSALLFSLAACQKKEEQPVTRGPMRQGPIIDTPSAPPGHGAPGKKTEFQVVVPEDIKDQWSAVKIIVDDKKENRKQEFIVTIGEELKIPDSNLTIKIGPFLPDFKMSGTVITSSSNNPNNPSVGVAVMEDSKQLFPASGKWGWLYSKFPTVHSFQHERFGLSLVEGVKK